MKDSNQCTKNVSFILELPEDFDTERLVKLAKHIPSEMIMFGIIHWVLTNAQEPLNDLVESIINDPIIDEKGENITDKIEQEMYDFFPFIREALDEQIRSFLPIDYTSPKYVKDVAIDVASGTILMTIDPDAEDEEENDPAAAASALIESELEEEDDDQSTDGDEDEDTEGDEDE